MNIQRRINCYITTQDENDGVVMLFRSVQDKTFASQWGLLSYDIVYEENDKHSFSRSFMHGLQQRIQLNVSQVVVLDVSDEQEFWIKVETPSTQVGLMCEDYVEFHMFDHAEARKLPKTHNFEQFLKLYPTPKAIANRFEQMQQKRSH